MPAKNAASKHEPWYVEERLHALAVVHLTRRNDLTLVKAPDSSGLDFIVEIHEHGRLTGQRFGVQLLPLSDERRPRKVPVVSDVPFPVCVLFFDVASEHAMYAWAREPVVTDQGDARLVDHSAQEAGELTRAAIDQIVAQVNRWYGALLENLAG